MLDCTRRTSILVGLAGLLTACGPRQAVPPRPLEPQSVPGAVSPGSPTEVLAKSLAPVLFVHRDERFPLSRAVAVVHPTRRVIAYHLLWRDDIHGSWIPFTVPTDQEIVWVGYDTTGVPTDIWTFWHGKILHANWQDRGTAAVNIQWGKHGSLPRGVIESDLPRFRSLNAFYLFTWVGIPDMWLGKLMRPGPGCFCYGYDRYREFSRPLVLGERLDLVAQADHPGKVLTAVFGRSYSKKVVWP